MYSKLLKTASNKKQKNIIEYKKHANETNCASNASLKYSVNSLP